MCVQNINTHCYLPREIACKTIFFFGIFASQTHVKMPPEIKNQNETGMVA